MWQRTLRIWKLNLSGAKRQSQTPVRVLLAETKTIRMNLQKNLFPLSSGDLSPNQSPDSSCEVPLCLWMSGLHRTVWMQGPQSSGCSRTLPTRVLPVFLRLLWTPCPRMFHLLPESLLPQGNVLPPRPSIEKCSSNYLFQSSACWGTQTDTFPMGKNLATAKAAVSSWKGFRIIVWRSTATLFMKWK